MTEQHPKITPRTTERTFIKAISLTPSEDQMVNQAAIEWGIKYSSAIRRIINEWAAAQTQTPG